METSVLLESFQGTYPLNVVISASEADSKFLELTPNGNSKFTVKQHDPKKKKGKKRKKKLCLSLIQFYIFSIFVLSDRKKVSSTKMGLVP